MKKTNRQFSKGDWIVHVRHGVGQIAGLDTKELAGEKQDFYLVTTGEMEYWLPVSEADSGRVRRMAPPERFEEAAAILGGKPEKMDDNSRRRLLHIEAMRQDGKLLTRAQIIRDLNARAYQKYIHINERRILDNLKEQFTAEWAAACGIEEPAARKRMRSALEKSCNGLKPKKPLL